MDVGPRQAVVANFDEFHAQAAQRLCMAQGMRLCDVSDHIARTECTISLQYCRDLGWTIDGAPRMLTRCAPVILGPSRQDLMEVPADTLSHFLPNMEALFATIVDIGNHDRILGVLADRGACEQEWALAGGADYFCCLD